jgi:hypothetical protein
MLFHCCCENELGNITPLSSLSLAIYIYIWSENSVEKGDAKMAQIDAKCESLSFILSARSTQIYKECAEISCFYCEWKNIMDLWTSNLIGDIIC